MLRLPLVLSCCAAVAAQQTSAAPAANRFVPADSCLVVRCASPAKWQKHFAKTQLAKLIQSPSMAPLLAEFTTGFEEALGRVRTEGNFDPELLDKLWQEYEGDLVLSLQLDWDDVPAAAQEGRQPRMSIVAALSPGEGLDLAALAGELTEQMERKATEQRPMRDATIGDLQVRITGDERMTAMAPTLIDGHLVTVFATSTDFEPVAARLLASEGRLEGDSTAHPMHVQARLGDAMRVVMPMLAEQMQGQAPFDIAAVIESLGLASLQDLSLQLDADGPHMTLEFGADLRADAEGLWGTVMFAQTPRLLRFVPPSCDWFSTTPFDVGALFATVKRVWHGLGEDVPLSFDQAMQAFGEATKVRLEEDLIAHLGTEMLMVDDVEATTEAAADEEEEYSTLSGSCIAWALRDGKAFGQSIEALLRSRGLHAARKSEDYADTKIYRLKPGGLVEVEYAITDDLLVLVLGNSEIARRNLRAVLDARAAAAATAELPAKVQAHVAALPTGWSGLSVTPVGPLMQGIGNTVQTMLTMQGVDAEELEWAGLLQQIAGDIRRLGIDHMVGATWTTKRSLRSRMRW
ncbi:MAG: hypothetical protein JNL08_07980 [Planctomycetes bacterium]|nr:hypothetical protein [Planctomycetota bacterium]